MQIRISSYNDSVNISKKELKQVVNFFLSCLFSKVKTKRKIEKLTISFDDGNFADDPKDIAAFCFGISKPGKRKPAEFTIELNKRLTRGAIIKALAHEMVHVRQFFLGELTVNKQGQFVWKKSAGKFDDYFECPWEIEAFGYEIGLVTKYRLFCKEIGFNVRNRRRSPSKTSSRSNAEVAATQGL
jgi:hypothetical protein